MNTKLLFTIIIILVVGAVAVIGLRFFSGDEDTWLCQNDQWVKHGNPSAPMPASGCTNPNPEPEVIITSPQPNQIVTSPLTVEGKARGGQWFFESNAILRLLDGQGQEIAVSNVMATTDWMTANDVEFKGQIRFISPASGTGTLIFKNDNPSGLPQNDKEFRVPIRFDTSQIMKVKAYFSNNNLDPQVTCTKVFPVEREIPKTQEPARAALEELLAGPAFKEQNQGYSTSINPDVKIQSLTIASGMAKVDFNEALQFQAGGSCRVSAIRSQIIETLKQFPTVQNIIISINGKTEDILQP